MGVEIAVLTVEAVPARLFLESQDQQQELIRELRLIEIAERFDLTVRNVSRQLGMLISEILDAWDDVRASTRRQAVAALERGDEEVNLTIPVRPGLGEALRRWLALLDEADQFCRDGELLTLPPSDEVRQLRAWYVEEIVSRLPFD